MFSRGPEHVQVSGVRRFQQGFDEIRGLLVTTGSPPISSPDTVRQEAKENRDRKDERELCRTREKLVYERETIAEPETFYMKSNTSGPTLGPQNRPSPLR